MLDEYKFVIIKGKKTDYNNELKRIKDNYPKTSIPIPTETTENVTVWMTPNEELYNHFKNRNYIENLEILGMRKELWRMNE